LFDAGTTVGARPEHVGVDHTGRLTVLAWAADQRTLRFRQGECVDIGVRITVAVTGQADLFALHVLLATRQQIWRLVVTVVTQLGDQQFRGEWLAGVPRGALILTPAALGAGGEVEPALPGEVLDLPGAENVLVGIGL